MAEITAKQVKELREQTGAGMMDAIKENITIRRFTRYEADANGAIATYIHAGGKIGVMVELVVARGEKSAHANDVAKEVAMHVAASDPRFLRREDVTEKDLQ